MLQALLILLLALAAAILYGILHDQITIRICLEYFTVYHAPLFGDLKNPTLLAIGWGIVATWWVGAILGVPLALAARVGPMPKRSAASMIRPIAILLACMALCAALAGIISYFVHANRGGALFDPLTSGIPINQQVAFKVDLWTHLASYASGFLGGLALIIWTLTSRHKNHVSLLMSRLRDADTR